MYKSAIDKDGSAASYPYDFMSTQYKMHYNMAHSSPVKITIWDGFVMGAGAGVSMFS